MRALFRQLQKLPRILGEAIFTLIVFFLMARRKYICIYVQNKVQLERRRAGQYPALPDIADRAAIKAEYMKTKPT